MHEIGHAIGMFHEQSRPDGDGSVTFKGQTEGPYIKIHWTNVQAGSQWRKIPREYTGSNHQQPHDPHSGYAKYDYESIMHYSWNDRNEFETVPNANDKWLTTGNYNLAQSDINQAND